jgi:hypothetical protein
MRYFFDIEFINHNGSSESPWRTPDSTLTKGDFSLSTASSCDRLRKKPSIHRTGRGDSVVQHSLCSLILICHYRVALRLWQKYRYDCFSIYGEICLVFRNKNRVRIRIARPKNGGHMIAANFGTLQNLTASAVSDNCQIDCFTSLWDLPPSYWDVTGAYG